MTIYRKKLKEKKKMPKDDVNKMAIIVYTYEQTVFIGQVDPNLIGLRKKGVGYTETYIVLKYMYI